MMRKYKIMQVGYWKSKIKGSVCEGKKEKRKET